MEIINKKGNTEEAEDKHRVINDSIKEEEFESSPEKEDIISKKSPT